jgi:hypothetical protein
MCSSRTLVALYSLALLPFALFFLHFPIRRRRFGKADATRTLDKVIKFASMSELPIVQKTYDLIKWYVPILNRLPRDHKFQLGDRMISGLYDLLESLIYARYQREKLQLLEPINSRLDVMRHQTRLLLDFELNSTDRYEYASKLINSIGTDLGGWIEQQRRKGSQ